MTATRFDLEALSHAEARRAVRDCARSLVAIGDTPSPDALNDVRKEYVRLIRDLPVGVGALTELCCSVLCDLRGQGWAIQAEGRGIQLAPPIPSDRTAGDRKAQVRAAHLVERNAQLLQPATRRFIRAMERRRLHRGKWVSIFSLMRDGRELADSLRHAAVLPSGVPRTDALRRCIDPYVQVVDPRSTCEFTGLRLGDVWRYFRHTWTTSYLSTPGRKVWFLVRDRAGANHPVIGIGALGSAVVQLTPRDRWIGWTPPEFLDVLKKAPTARWARWLDMSLSGLIEGIYVRDLRSEGIIDGTTLRHPSPAGISRLRKFAVAERRLHHLYPKRRVHKLAAAGGGTTDWATHARTHLFRAKRASALADLLEARRALLTAGFTTPSAAALSSALGKGSSSRAIRTVLRYVKARHVGVDLMDITVCGAVAPYNAVLGGKLVSLLMTSPEVTGAYAKRYQSAVSVIASAMAGRPVRRRPNLVLLGTTSLYNVAPAQYNRLHMPAYLAGGRHGREVSYLALGQTVGFGSYQFSRETMATVELVLARQRSGRPVNSIFGEGVNPKLRKVRTALDLLRMPSDVLLQHRSSRMIYAVPLATNFREVLLGLTTRPLWIVPPHPGATAGIIEFWRDRWLSKRIVRDETLVAVADHSLTHPIRHGARVVLPALSAEEGPLFDNLAAELGPGRPPLLRQPDAQGQVERAVVADTAD